MIPSHAAHTCRCVCESFTALVCEKFYGARGEGGLGVEGAAVIGGAVGSGEGEAWVVIR